MKKRVILFFLIMTAAVAAGFAFAGCQRTQPTWTKNEYVVFDDGCGKKYTLRGGEDITVYYEYDPEKQLNFTETYYDMDTGKVSRVYDNFDTRSCSFPQAYTYNANPRTDGSGESSRLTVIISAQTVSAHIDEHGLYAFDWLKEDVGACYSFIPEMSGRYTVNCELKEQNGEVIYDISDVNGVVVGDGILSRGQKYGVHVRVKSHDGTGVGVTTSVAFTPDVVALGENSVTLGKSNVFEFTPGESGIYSVTDTEDSFLGYAILNGETYEMITDTQWEHEAPLIASKKYFFQSQTGYSQPREATLTVKFADNPLPLDEETECGWSKYYAVTVPEKCNYTVNVQLQNKYTAVAQLTVYDEQGLKELEYTFRDSCEQSLVLAAGKHYIRVDESSKITCKPTPVTWQSGQRLESGERSVFVAQFSCKYDFESTHTGAEVKVLDKDGKSVADEKLTAGEEYTVYTEFEATYENGYEKSCWVSADPRIAGELGQNVTVENVADGEPYSFSPERWGRYKFTGAVELKVYSWGSTPCETYGDTVELRNDRFYYVVMVADELTYGKSVTVRYYPQALPTDGLTHVTDMKLHFALPFDDEVSINIRHSGEIEYSLFDADFNEVMTGSFDNGKTGVKSQITAQLQAGYYYIFLSSAANVWFDAPPLGCGGIYTVERGDRFSSSPSATYMYVCGLGCEEITLNVFGRDLMYRSIIDEVNLYYMDDGTKRKLQINSIEFIHECWGIRFDAVPNVGVYLLEFNNHSYDFAFEPVFFRYI